MSVLQMPFTAKPAAYQRRADPMCFEGDLSVSGGVEIAIRDGEEAGK